MILTPGGGPVGGPTSRDAAGLLAPEAVRAQFPAGERSEAAFPFTDRDLDPVLHVIAPGERLHVFVYPELDDALTWGATHVAVDLELSDGTRLSELGAPDQYGTAIDAAAQGAAKILYADQWNDVQVDLSPAVGRTIVGVLVVADPPAGAGVAPDLTAWFDTPRIEPIPADPPVDDPVAWVDTRRGTNASGDFSRGNNLPITAWPNGFAFFTPMTDARSLRWPYQYQRANDAQNRPRLQGLAVSHQPSPWMGDRNQLIMMPLTEPDATPVGRSRAFTHDEETARPDLYAVTLEDGTQLQLAPSDHGAVLEVTFPEAARRRALLLEGADENTRLDLAGAVFDGTFAGWVDNGTDGEERSAGRSRMFVAGTLDPLPEHVGPAGGDLASARVATFADDVRTVTMRLATSFIGVEQARHTLDLELAGRDLRTIQRAAHAAWTERLGVIGVEGATAPQRRTLYGNLYRLNLYPNSQHENTGSARDPRPMHASPVAPTRGEVTDMRTNAQIIAGELFVNHGFWDTYRTCWPAFALLYPQLAPRLVDGFVQHYREGGWIPRWSSPGYADCMTGTSSDVAFADVQVKGIPLRDPLATYEAGLRNATVASPDPLVGRKGADRAMFTGYVDTDTPESVSWTLEAHINDQGLAHQARLLAEAPENPGTHELSEQRRRALREEAEYLEARSAGFALLFDPAIGFFQGRRADGAFAQSPEKFDPRDWGGDFTETDGWNFAFHVPHDGEGLAALYGGREQLRAKLEEFFATPETGRRPGTYGGVIHEMHEARAVRMGQFGMSNQPSHHIPFLFHHAGAPHRAQEVVREVHRRLFTGEQIGQGYPGDEDNGEMSAWWLLTALGLYPLQLGTDVYHLVAPLFDVAHVRPLGGEEFTIRVEDQAMDHPYIQAVRREGTLRSTSFLRHGDLRGEIRVQLGAEPGPADAPPDSPTPPGEAPRPLVDLLARDPEDPLLDDDSRTETLLEPVDGEVVIDLPLTAPSPDRIAAPSGSDAAADGALPDHGALDVPVPRFLTLTSGAHEGQDPSSWRLEVREDDVDPGAESAPEDAPGDGDARVSAAWRVVDERSGETFRWRRQTRPFALPDVRGAVGSPLAGPVRFRLVLTGVRSPIALAQIELLAPAPLR
ncbi:GH92 family glycosyl hydrolase [Brachybacterium halotolerans subsp. kimchii]|uniref:GH92 family glycosyl hydrolase n=1 Tax=Brachybacterium halotolerans TaxID=2795215 RepID=UPI001E4A5488|nr:GH92 family glycosyl hydrolase [Brachybacterium halotolerans]UEJ82033.1 GH92 family glycosyl hydrolase [Brachybacterium halotolerans subsp. kimchii]